MPYLVDGNNLMRRGQGRRDLLEELASFAARKRVRVSVAFDGAPEKNFPDGSSFKGVKVFYHERNSNADERIKRIVETSKERRTLFVVTDDRALADYIRRSGARIVGCRQFREQLDSTVLSTVSEKQETVKQDEIASWMRYFGVDETDD
jgi:predicted RNA-binding protein with PIN domain